MSGATKIPGFGGRTGVAALLVASHLIPYYLWIAWRFEGGALPRPDGLADLGPWLGRMAGHVAEAAPTSEALLLYLAFLGIQAIFAVVLPGLEVKGLPLPGEGGRRLVYRCNGLHAWYLTLAGIAALHFSGTFPLSHVGDLFGPLMSAAILVADAIAVIIYVLARRRGLAGESPLRDFFLGAWLNPRIGRLDLKMWAEVRVSWLLLFVLTASAAATQVAEYGRLSTPMIFMLVAHGLYTNATVKGEECIPTTWDIFHERWGWMLIFWNLAGVPFVYTVSAWYLASRPPFEHSPAYTALCFVLLLGAYYVWDTAQSQRNRFRMQQRGTYVRRRAFPQLPWGTLKDPEYIETRAGSRLLVDGWWRYARKIHYTADLVMALSWGLICGFDHYLPYFYASFFAVMITHRAERDIARCRAKYGEDWDRYVARVPWLFVPFVF
ncbi:MAG: delta(24(24(1)))-sterol reductase [Myxococcales bacterium]|nr:delta(24(24(1)))-sterol reductase [Myxococcales bacterium]